MTFDIVYKFISMSHFIFKLMISDLYNIINKDILSACKAKCKSGSWTRYNSINIKLEQCTLIKANNNIFALQKGLLSAKRYKKILIISLLKMNRSLTKKLGQGLELLFFCCRCPLQQPRSNFSLALLMPKRLL